MSSVHLFTAAPSPRRKAGACAPENQVSVTTSTERVRVNARNVLEALRRPTGIRIRMCPSTLRACTRAIWRSRQGGGVGTARALARAYGVFATAERELGLRQETLHALMAPARPPARGFFDECLKIDWQLSLGFAKPSGHGDARVTLSLWYDASHRAHITRLLFHVGTAQLT
jgi:hypothetical protein